MSFPTSLALATATLLVSVAGCEFDQAKVDQALAPATEALEVPPLGQVLVRMLVGGTGGGTQRPGSCLRPAPASSISAAISALASARPALTAMIQR